MARKAPTYTPREDEALRAADRVVCRIRRNGEWYDQEFYPAAGQTIRQKLIEIQAEINSNKALAKVCLYVGAMVRGERMIANVPHNFIPEQLA